MLLSLLGMHASAHADAVADFYSGRTVRILVGVSPGGEYDVHARLIARHLGRHIPGNPIIVVQNMPGAGGLAMANYLYNLAPKDGSTLGVVANGSLSQQAVGLRNIQYDAGNRQDLTHQYAGGQAMSRRFTWTPPPACPEVQSKGAQLPAPAPAKTPPPKQN